MPQGKKKTGQKAKGKKGQSKAAKARKQARDFSLGLQSFDAGPVSLQGLNASYTRNLRGLAPTVGLAPHAADIQTVMPEVHTSIDPDTGLRTDILTGTDLVTAVTGSTTDVAGTVLKKILINPSAFPNTRMAQMAPLYQRYRFLEIDFFYEPIAPATQRGQLLGFCDFDVDTELPDADPQNLQRGAAHEGQAICQVWEPQIFAMKQPSTFTDLFVSPQGEDPRLSYQGVFYLLSASVQDDSALGNIYMRYRLQFTIPQMQTGLGVVSGAFGQVMAPSATSLFGTSITVDDLSTISVLRNSDDQITVTGLTPGGIILLSYGAYFSGTGFGTQSGVGVTTVGATSFHDTSSVQAISSTQYRVIVSWLGTIDSVANEVSFTLTQAIAGSWTLEGNAYYAVACWPLDAASHLTRMRTQKKEMAMMLRQWKAQRNSFPQIESGQREPSSSTARRNPDPIQSRDTVILPHNPSRSW
jgi:hypothetical protein